MRKKRTIDMAVDGGRRKKVEGEEGGDDEYDPEDYYDEEDYGDEYGEEGEFVAPELMFRNRSDADLMEDSETRAAKAAAREAQRENEEELLEDQDGVEELQDDGGGSVERRSQHKSKEEHIDGEHHCIQKRKSGHSINQDEDD